MFFSWYVNAIAYLNINGIIIKRPICKRNNFLSDPYSGYNKITYNVFRVYTLNRCEILSAIDLYYIVLLDSCWTLNDKSFFLLFLLETLRRDQIKENRFPIPMWREFCSFFLFEWEVIRILDFNLLTSVRAVLSEFFLISFISSEAGKPAQSKWICTKRALTITPVYIEWHGKSLCTWTNMAWNKQSDGKGFSRIDESVCATREMIWNVYFDADFWFFFVVAKKILVKVVKSMPNNLKEINTNYIQYALMMDSINSEKENHCRCQLFLSFA